jgi:predicted DNA-binding antitoxin AbrB/MazE fold protein
MKRGNSMTRQFEAVYKGGFLRPLQPVELLEDQKVFVTIANVPAALNDDFLDTDLHRYCEDRAKTKDPSITLESVRQELASIPGSMSDDIIADREERF